MENHSNYTTAVYNLQRYLRQLSYNDPKIPTPPQDGIFDENTKKSLTEFQKIHSLPPNGIADKNTWDILFGEYLISRERYSAPMTLDIFPRVPDDYSVSLGDDFFLVSVIQFLLNELTIAYDSFIPLLISGVYDEATAKNIREFQQKNALEESGNVNKETWNRLVEAYSASASNYVY